MRLCHFIPVPHGVTHHASLAGVNICKMCMLVALTTPQLCRKYQQSQHTLRLSHLYAHIIVNIVMRLPHPAWLNQPQSAFSWLICLCVTSLHHSAANRCAWASHRRQQMVPQLWLLWVLTVSCKAAGSPAPGVKLESWICPALVTCVA